MSDDSEDDSAAEALCRELGVAGGWASAEEADGPKAEDSPVAVQTSGRRNAEDEEEEALVVDDHGDEPSAVEREVREEDNTSDRSVPLASLRVIGRRRRTKVQRFHPERRASRRGSAGALSGLPREDKRSSAPKRRVGRLQLDLDWQGSPPSSPEVTPVAHLEKFERSLSELRRQEQHTRFESEQASASSGSQMLPEGVREVLEDEVPLLEEEEPCHFFRHVQNFDPDVRFPSGMEDFEDDDDFTKVVREEVSGGKGWSATRQIVCGGWICSQYSKQVCTRSMMRWLFLLVAYSEDFQVRRGAIASLTSLLTGREMGASRPFLLASSFVPGVRWLPTFEDFSVAMLEHGAAAVELGACRCGGSGLASQTRDSQACSGIEQRRDNVELLMQLLGLVVTHSPQTFMESEIVCLACALCRMLADDELFFISESIAIALEACFDWYEESSWKNRLAVLARRVAAPEFGLNLVNYRILLYRFPSRARAAFFRGYLCSVKIFEVAGVRADDAPETFCFVRVSRLSLPRAPFRTLEVIHTLYAILLDRLAASQSSARLGSSTDYSWAAVLESLRRLQDWIHSLPASLGCQFSRVSQEAVKLLSNVVDCLISSAIARLENQVGIALKSDLI